MSKQELYLQTQIKTASPQELTLMLYNGCIRFMKQAVQAMENRNFADKNYFIQRTRDIINELIISLNMEYDIAHDLKRHYDFVNQKLVEANIKMDVNDLNFCIGHITELRDAWGQAMKNVKMKNQVTS